MQRQRTAIYWNVQTELLAVFRMGVLIMVVYESDVLHLPIRATTEREMASHLVAGGIVQLMEVLKIVRQSQVGMLIYQKRV